MRIMEKLKLGIIGVGFLGNIIVDAYLRGDLEEYELVGVYGRNTDRTADMAEKAGCKACSSVEELLELKPDYVAEAASVPAVRDMAEKVLSAGASLVVLSIGAFADQDFYDRMKKTAREHGAKIYIASGAVGGFDVLRTVALMGDIEAGIETRKGPESLIGTPVFKEQLMTDEQESEVFAGSAKEAIALLPDRVNVAVASALATAGPEKTGVHIYSIPGMRGDDHKITAEIEGVRAVVDIYSESSAIAAWSVVAVLRNLVSVVVF